MFMKRFLAHKGYAMPNRVDGQDLSNLEEDDFDEKVLDKEDTSDEDGSKFKSDEEDEPDPDLEDEMPEAKPKAKEKSPVEKKKDAKGAKEEPKTLADADEIANKKEADEPPVKKGVIPVDRHETILSKMRDERDEAVRALANAQGGQKIVQTNTEITTLESEVDALQDKYDEALIDGERDVARGLAKQLRAKERELGDKKTSIAVSIARAEAIESTRFDMARERIEQAYTVLQPGHEDYDQKVMNEVLELTRLYQAGGYTATDAMQKAVRKELGASSVTQQQAAEVKPRVTDEHLTDKRKENAVDKALKTKQPPSTEKVGLDNDKLGRKHTAKDVLRMSDKEFDALSDEELAKLGGDFRLVEEEAD